MTYDELIQTLIDAHWSDWLRDEGEGVWTLKGDLHVTVRERRDANPGKLDEPWATFHQPAVIRIFEVWYGASFIMKYHFASVDGGRALLPYPKTRDELKITRAQLAVALAVNGQANSLHEYLHRVGMMVE